MSIEFNATIDNLGVYLLRQGQRGKNNYNKMENFAHSYIILWGIQEPQMMKIM